jgi:acetolactate decarboxylase
MKSFRIATLFVTTLLFALVISSTRQVVFAQGTTDPHTPQVLTQVSTYDYFAAGHYDGFLSIADLHKYGDFGLGTFDKVNGEMVEVDGKIYQIQADGKPHLADETNMTPFAVVTFWHASTVVTVPANLALDKFKALLDQTSPNQSQFVAIRVEGTFSTLKLRSEEPAAKPYPILTDFLKNQIVFNLTNVKGTLVGVRAPAFSQGLQVVGYHFHFVSADGTAGGHVLDLTSGDSTLQVNEIPAWEILLPPAGADQPTATPQVSK